jgi:hypothetical protein
MSTRFYVVVAVTALSVVGCESGDVVLSPTNVDNSVDNSTSTGGGGNNPCASYTDSSSGAFRQGVFDGANCLYSGAFVSQSNPLTNDLDIPFITGVHVFQESLIVGENVDNQTVPNPVPAEGEGPTLTIAPGSTLAFQDTGDYLGVMRGSQIIADGTPALPITFTGVTDAVLGQAQPESVQLWAGVIISGNGITNNCTDTERADGTCGVLSEGDNFSFYGGDDNAESSGILRYVIIKHTGFGPSGNEIQALTLNGVGSGTTIENIQAYASADDGIEFFGGAVDVTNYIGMYLQDDSLDYTDGYIGTITNALIIQGQNSGNRCVEGDGIGEGRYLAGEDPLLALPYTNPTIVNMTCILSNAEPAGSDESEGPTTRRGPQSQMASSIIWGAYSDDSDSGHECFEMNDDETLQFAEDGDSTMIDTLIACEEAVKGTLVNTDALSDWALGLVTGNGDYSFNTNNTIIEEADIFANGNLNVLDCFYTDTTLIDNNGVDITANYPSQLGAVTRADDWTQPWAIGLEPADLWFPCP